MIAGLLFFVTRTDKRRLVATSIGVGLLFACFATSKPIDDSPRNLPVHQVGFTDWKTKNVEDIQVGDWVLSREEHGSELQFKQVEQTFVRTADHLVKVSVDSGSDTFTLETTKEHPFWVEGQGWVPAIKLLKGQKLTDPNANALTVAEVDFEPHADGVQVYNCEVHEFHTYFVRANGSRAPPVLVHNNQHDQRTRVNLGGEGEIPGIDVVNVQPKKIGGSTEIADQNVERVRRKADPQPVVQADGNDLPFPDGSVDEVYLNNAPLDAGETYFGPSFTSDEINRILKPDGTLFHNGVPKIP